MTLSRTAVARGFTVRNLPEPAQAVRRRWWRHLVFLGVSCLLALLTLGLAGTAIRRGWQADFRSDFIDNVVFPAIQSFIPCFLLQIQLVKHSIETSETRDQMALVLPIRRALKLADDNLAPIAAIQPQPLGADLPIGRTRWGPLKPPPDGRGIWMVEVGAILLALGSFVAVILVFGSSNMTVDEAHIYAGVGAGMIVLGMAILLRGIAMRRDIRVTADEWQLRWKSRHWWGNKTRTLPWHQVDSFAVVPLNALELGLRGLHPMRQMYVLDTSSAIFAWIAPLKTEAVAYAIHERFLGEVAARVAVPLRDPSAALSQLAPGQGGSTGGRAHQDRGRAQGHRSVARSRPSAVPPEVVRARLALVYQAFSIPLIFLVVFLVGMWLSLYH